MCCMKPPAHETPPRKTLPALAAGMAADPSSAAVQFQEQGATSQTPAKTTKPLLTKEGPLILSCAKPYISWGTSERPCFTFGRGALDSTLADGHGRG